MKNSGDSDFNGIFSADQADLLRRFIDENDFSPCTRLAFASDIRKFTTWFIENNLEPFEVHRVTRRDVADLRDHLSRQLGQQPTSVTCALVAVRSYFKWLLKAGAVSENPATDVKDLRRQQLAPKGLDRSQVRRLLREVELRGDVRANGVFSLMLYTGCRVSDAAQLELRDLLIYERSGHVVYRHGKGNKQRTCPLPQPARKALVQYLDVRPPVPTPLVFVGERGPLLHKIPPMRGLLGPALPFSPAKIEDDFFGQQVLAWSLHL